MSPKVAVPLVLLLVLQLQVSLTSGNEEADFTKHCSHCRCSWKSGRKSADCTNQRIPDVPRDLSNDIQILDLSNNQIDSILANEFQNAHQQNLQKLYLRNNSMKQIHKDAFRNLTILIELDLSSNNLTRLDPGIFDDLIKIRVIIMNSNQIERIENNLFRNLVYLMKVDLRDNRLKHIAQNSFVDVQMLSQILLDNNNLQILRKQTFVNLGKLTSLSLTNNPWNCTCALKNFSEFVINKNLYTSPTVCAGPASLLDKQWNEIQIDDFACPPTIIENRIQYPGNGENATFICKVTGLPLPTIDWLFQKRSISTHGRLQVRQAFRTARDQSEMLVSELIIMGVRPTDRGHYVCKATNRGGIDESEQFFDLKIDPNPMTSATRSKNVQWIIITVVLIVVLLATLCGVISWWCFRRKTRKFKKNTTMSESRLMKSKLDKSQNDSIQDSGSVIVEMQKILITDVNPVEKPPRRVDVDTGDKVDYDEKHDVKQILLEENGNVTQDEETASLALSDATPRSRATFVDDGYGTNLTPDLLAFPSRFPQSPSIQSSMSNIHDGRMYAKSPLSSPIYQHGPSLLGGVPAQIPAGFRTLQHSKTGRTIAIASQRSNSPFTPAPLIYPQIVMKQGYVTIPRKPRTPSWTPSMSSTATAELLSPTSPTSPVDRSAVEPVYDNLGLRTTASGNSTLKLNKQRQPNTSTPVSKYSMKDRPLPATPGAQTAPVATATSPVTGNPGNYEAIPEKASVVIGGRSPVSDLEPLYGRTVVPMAGPSGGRSKVPPRPPPKPKKKPSVGNFTGEATLPSSNSSTTPLFTDEGEDGTEV